MFLFPAFDERKNIKDKGTSGGHRIVLSTKGEERKAQEPASETRAVKE